MATVARCLTSGAGLRSARRALAGADATGLTPCLCCHSSLQPAAGAGWSSSSIAAARTAHLDPLGGGALPLLADAEGTRLPAELARFRPIDAHTHLFPPRLQLALLRWFKEHAWPCRHEELLTRASGGSGGDGGVGSDGGEGGGTAAEIEISRFLLDR